MSTVQPLRQVYSAIWTMLEANADFASAVPSVNRIKYSGDDIEPEKEEASNADRPEVTVLFLTAPPHLHATSNAGFLDIGLEIRIATDARGLWDALDVFWYVYRAFNLWPTYLKAALTWNDETFVHRARLTDVKLNPPGTNPDGEKGMRGWTVVAVGDVSMHFQTSDLGT